MKVTVIDYGMGNLTSVAGAIRKLGHLPVVSNKIEDLEKADKLVLPGVGAFGDAIKNIVSLGIKDTLDRIVLKAGKPVLGICLGAQLFARESFEFGRHEGLGWIDASVVKLDTKDRSLRIPHVGWNGLRKAKESVLYGDIPEDALFYYVHSYYVECADKGLVTGTCNYGVDFTASFEKKNIYGVQFHPEKSQLYGLRVMENFLKRA